MGRRAKDIDELSCEMLNARLTKKENELVLELCAIYNGATKSTIVKMAIADFYHKVKGE